MSDTQTREIAPTIPTKLDRSTWTLETYHEPIIDRGNGIISRTIEVGGSGPGSADTLARQAVYAGCENMSDRLATAADANAKITVLRVGETYLGTPVAQIRQGSAFHSSRGIGLLPTGNRTKGVSLTGVLDVLDGTGEKLVTEIGRRWSVGTGLPETTAFNEEALKAATMKHPVAILWTHPGFGSGRVPGCIWIVESLEVGIINGYLWCPPSELESEHGSIYPRDLVGKGALFTVPPVITAGDAFDLPQEPRAAYREIFGL